MDEVVLCAMCKVRGVCGKGVDRSGAAKAYSNPVDKLTSTVSWPTIWSKYCYFCDKKNSGLIRALGSSTRLCQTGNDISQKE